LSLCSTNSCFR